MIPKRMTYLMIAAVLLVLAVFFVKNNTQKEAVQSTPSTPSCVVSKQVIAKLQKELNNTSAQGGGIVKMKACQYTLSKPLLLPSNVHLQGAGIGKTLVKIAARKKNGKVNDHKAIQAVEGSKNITISDLTIDGDKDHRRELINTDAHTLALAKVDGFSVKRVKIIHSASASIILFNSSNGTIQHCEIVDSGSNGILALQQVENVKVLDNTIDGTDEQNGIFFSYQEGRSSSNIVIERNTVKQAGDFGIEVGHIVPEDGPQHQNIIVRDNKVLNSTNAGIAFRTVSSGTIENNIISGYGRHGGYGGDGIFVEGGFNTSYDNKVLNNTIKQFFRTGKANAIYVTGLDRALVKGNKIRDSRGAGIMVQASLLPDNITTKQFPSGRRLYDRIEVLENDIQNSRLDGIHFQGLGSQGNMIVGNTVSGNRSYGIEIANMEKGSGFQIENNHVTGNDKQGLLLYQESNPQVIGNLFKNNNQNGGAGGDASALSLVDAENIVLKQNTFEDNQKKATQLYDVGAKNLMGWLVNEANVYKGGTEKTLKE